jgi:hypothetical protein
MITITEMYIPTPAKDLTLGTAIMLKGEHGKAKPHTVTALGPCGTDRSNIHVAVKGIGHTLCYYSETIVIVKEV